jgi:hypothetical protein
MQIVDAAAAGELVGAMDTAGSPVTSIWIDDPSAGIGNRCDASTTSGPPWEYGTGHLGCKGRSATVNGTTGALGAIDDVGGTPCGSTHSVGCCMP